MAQTAPRIGLTEKQVEESRAKHGANVLTPPEKTPLWKLFLEKFQDPIIRILLLALLASVGISCFEFSQGEAGLDAFFEPAGILFAIILATGIAFWFEVRANRAFDILNQVSDEDPVQVVRGENGTITEVPKRDIVVGDIVILNTGNEIPADGELIEAISLQINESTLTGEPLVKKSVREEDFDKDATYPTNHALRGTTVVDGHGVMRVTAVGDQTENGRVFVAAQIDNSVKTPLNHQLDRLSAVITKVSYAMAALIVAGRVLLYFINMNTTGGFEWLPFLSEMLQTVMIAVTLIVVSVPEGLPMSVTLSLAMSMRRMLKAQSLVRKMHACETMGATTVICTDKTGTLTQNQMRVYETRFFPVPDDTTVDFKSTYGQLIAEGIAVNSTAFLDLNDSQPRVMGNPTEGALLLWLHSLGLDYEALRGNAAVEEQLTFSTERKYMGTVVRSALLPGKRILYLKGAPEIVFGLCCRAAAGITQEQLSAMLLGYQQKAMRTLGFAYQILDDTSETFRDGRCTARNLTFLGFAAISDPVRPDVPDAVKACIDAGINVKIVTGDTPGTAREIGRQIGLWQPGDNARCEITGPEFAALTDAELEERILDLKIISRARPMDKKRLVETLQKKGQVVAVTGDGTNDAPALKAAHVGLSMGDGTGVAKEASDITIMDSSFASIANAVMWGRSLYKNIQRFILFQMTINVSACLVVLLGAFTGKQSPLTVTQMLWVNIIMDTFAAMALASLPPSREVMSEQPRRRDDFIITRAMWKRLLGTGLLFTAILMALAEYFRYFDVTALTSFFSATHDGSGLLTRYEESLFFTLFVLLQLWNMFNARAFATHHSALSHIASARGFLLIAALILAGQIVIVTFGGSMFGVTPLCIADWLLLLLITSPVLLVPEMWRRWKK